ncbi:MAG: flagellar basal body L-ring protein FlgH [Phycisphaerae bacterium]|nr:flagellar basal body L-ring protein FlgH [Phycisphaerae bacterium]
MKYVNLWIIAASVVLLVAQASPGGSIVAKTWKRTAHTNIYRDDKASGIGDVLTIQISEDGTVDTKKGNTNSKTAGDSGSGSGSFTFGDLFPGLGKKGNWGFGEVFTLPTWDYSSTNASNLTGKADHKNTYKYTDKITVVVEDVMPNGNLLVLGKRVREFSGNKLTIQASGIVRPSDIDATNIVSSTRVANFHLVFTDRGRENHYLNNGWMMRIWNLINPF